MAGRLIVPPTNPSLDANGEIAAGATLTFYQNGTTTPQSIYSDPTLATPLANPLTCDAAGRFPQLWADDGTNYSVKWTPGTGATPITYDAIQPLTGNSFKDGNFSIQNSSDITKIAKFDASGITAGTTRNFKFPDVTNDTFAMLAATQTLTNKTLDSPTITTTETINTRNSTNAQRAAITILNGNSGGTGSNFIATQMTDNVSAAATILTAPNRSTLVQVYGVSGANAFSDILNCGTTAVSVISSLTNDGSPASRTYSVTGSSLKLAMSAGNYNINVLAIGADQRN